VLELPNGLPRNDVLRRVVSLLKPAAFPNGSVRWLPALRVQAAVPTGVDLPVRAVDGKTARRRPDPNQGRGALGGVRGWASAWGTCAAPAAPWPPRSWHPS